MQHQMKRLPPNALSVCEMTNCGKRAVAFHLCSAHYSKFKKYSDPNAGRTNDGTRKAKRELPVKKVRLSLMCSVGGCHDPVAKRGWCAFHYSRNLRFGDPLAGGPRRISPNSQGTCKVDGCQTAAKSLFFCNKHYAKWAKFGDPLGGTVQDGRSKEWRTNNDGYVYKFDPASPHAGPNKLVYQHRFVMGDFIGRPLLSSESVHHKNGNRSDNRLSNLELWSKGQPAGQRVEDKVKWARDVLREYGSFFQSTELQPRGKVDVPSHQQFERNQS